jgi:hypothetical protein
MAGLTRNNARCGGVASGCSRVARSTRPSRFLLHRWCPLARRRDGSGSHRSCGCDGSPPRSGHRHGRARHWRGTPSRALQPRRDQSCHSSPRERFARDAVIVTVQPVLGVLIVQGLRVLLVRKVGTSSVGVRTTAATSSPPPPQPHNSALQRINATLVARRTKIMRGPRVHRYLRTRHWPKSQRTDQNSPAVQATV